MSFKVGCTIAATVVAVAYFQNSSRMSLSSTNLNTRVQHAQARVLKTEAVAPVVISRQRTAITNRYQ